MQKFSDVLLTLEDASHVKRIALFNKDGSPAGVIDNKPGSQGSVSYTHLYRATLATQRTTNLKMQQKPKPLKPRKMQQKRKLPKLN